MGEAQDTIQPEKEFFTVEPMKSGKLHASKNNGVTGRFHFWRYWKGERSA